MSRVLPIVSFTILTASCFLWRGNALAQDVTITNAEGLAAVPDEFGLWYPLASPTEPSLSSQTLGIFWTDFSQLTNAIGDVRNFDGETQYGITVWRLRLTRTTNEVTVSYPAAATNLWQGPATDSDDFSTHYENVLRGYCILQEAMNYDSYDDLIADGYTNLAPQRIVTDIYIGDVNNCSTYDDNVASANSLALGTSTGGFMTMDEEPDGLGSDPCSITNLMQPFYVTSVTQGTNGTTITWPSCPLFRYIVVTANILGTNHTWAALGDTSYLWGQNNASATSWSDLSTTNASAVTQRFYKVERMLGSAIAAGGYHGLVILTNGTLWAWGGDDQTQLGDNASDAQAAPEPLTDSLCGVARLTNAVALAGGDDYSVAVDANGIVWSWGDGASGQLGDGGYTNVLTASPINGLSNIVSVAAGTDFTLALRADGTVWAWGNNVCGEDFDGNGQLGAGDLGGASSTNLPVRSLVPTGTIIVAIAAGSEFSLALDTTGLIWGWGENLTGQLGTNVTSANAGTTNLPTLVAGISNVIAIAAGDNHSVALTANKAVWTWGNNSIGALGRSGSGLVPGPVTALTNQNAVAIAAGSEFTLAVTSNGQIYAWGDNTYGELGTNSAVGGLSSTPLLVAGISNAVLVSAHAEGNQVLAVTVNQGTNQYYGWGANYAGQVGDGGGEDYQSTPAPLHFDDVCTTCVQLGTSGSFTAQYTGMLKLYFNDEIAADDDNSGSYTAQVFGVISTNVIVLASNGEGVVAGLVTKGSNYTYSASGICNWGPASADANGRDPVSQNLEDCSGFAAGGLCPNMQCFSLVGRIQ